MCAAYADLGALQGAADAVEQTGGVLGADFDDGGEAGVGGGDGDARRWRGEAAAAG